MKSILMYQFIMILLWGALAGAASDSKPNLLFSCKVPSSIPDIVVEISFVERGGDYELVQGSNMSHPTISSIKKPEFQLQYEKCMYTFKHFGRDLSVKRDGDTGEISNATKTLGKCQFTSSIKNCDPPSSNKMKAQPPIQEAIGNR